jgi:hypothetical protein
MRKHIISSVAAAALAAGVGVALAQSPSPPGAPSGSGSERSTGQAPGATQAPGLQDRGAKPPGQGTGSERAQERRGESSGAAQSNQSGAGATTGSVGSAGAAGRVNVTSDQQSRLTTVVKKVNIREANNVSATIAVGSILPSSVELVSVPSEIIEIVPTFSSYRAIRVGGRILIVEPDTRRIVYIINA